LLEPIAIKEWIRKVTIQGFHTADASLQTGRTHSFANIFALLLQVVIIIGIFVITVPNG